MPNLLKNLSTNLKNIFTKRYIRKPFQRPAICPSCGRSFYGWEERQIISQLGECLSCDHVRGDILDQQRMEVLNESN